MKYIIVYLAKHKLDSVLLELGKFKSLPGISVFKSVEGFGRGRGGHDGSDAAGFNMLHRSKLEIICNDNEVDALVPHIEHSASTGMKGDGKIFVLPVEQAVRISTHERGETAV